MDEWEVISRLNEQFHDGMKTKKVKYKKRLQLFPFAQSALDVPSCKYIVTPLNYNMYRFIFSKLLKKVAWKSLVISIF